MPGYIISSPRSLRLRWAKKIEMFSGNATTYYTKRRVEKGEITKCGHTSWRPADYIQTSGEEKAWRLHALLQGLTCSFSPFSIAITSLGEERPGLCVPRTSLMTLHGLIFDLFSLPRGVRGWLRHLRFPVLSINYRPLEVCDISILKGCISLNTVRIWNRFSLHNFGWMKKWKTF